MRKNKPSQTAYKVAVNIVTLGAKPGMEKVLPPGIVDATGRLLVASGAARKGAVRFAGSRSAVFLYETFDWMMPGQFEAFGYRKAFCERQAREGIKAGATQVLALGAGYDTLGWRLAPEFLGVSFFEIGHPATARLKARGIEAMGPRDNLHLIPEDLAQRKLVDVLRADNSWDSAARTVVLAEGLLMYLPAEAVLDLFRQCAATTGAGSRIAFSHVGTGSDGRPDAGKWTGLVLWILRTFGEPWLWSMCPEELAGFLEGTGWKNSPDLVGPTDKRGVEFFSIAEN
jgi:methyltransferase (TIGR00027 family)